MSAWQHDMRRLSLKDCSFANRSRLAAYCQHCIVQRGHAWITACLQGPAGGCSKKTVA